MEKNCTICLVSKDLASFSLVKNKKGDRVPHSYCMNCLSLKKKEDYLKHREKRLQTIHKYSESHKEQISEAGKQYRKTETYKVSAKRTRSKISYKEKNLVRNAKYREVNRLQVRTRINEWRRQNPLSGREQFARRRAAKLQRTPKWADLGAIKQFYLNCPEGMVVDHVIPLRGKIISGFHIVENLQYLTPEENLKKGNKYVG